MKKRMILLCVSIMLATLVLHADETVTVTATSSDVSENLDLKTVATLFGQAKDLENFEQMLNNPDSAFSNLDLNGDGEVDYLRVIETADGNRHLVVIQAVLAKDIYQDVASIFVEKDETNETVVVQVIGDEYVYGENYIIEPVYVYRPVIYDWFWGPSWVAWHSPYYWDYWPTWWRPYHCIDPYLYWDHCYWHHYHHPICSYRTGHHYHHHYHAMYKPLRRNDFAHRHPERSFKSRNVSRNYTNAHSIDRQRAASMRQTNAVRVGAVNASTRVSATSVRSGNGQTTATRNNTYGSSNVQNRSSISRTATSRAASASTATRANTANTSTVRSSATTTRSTTLTPVRSSSASTTRTTTATPARTSSTAVRPSTSTSVRSTSTTSRPSTSTSVRSTSTTSRPSTSSSVRSSSSSSMRSSGASMRSSSSSSSSRSASYGGSRTR